jgi:SAM-dependent methyltransferase
MNTISRDAAEQVLELANGYIVARAVHVIAELGIADQLDAGPRSVAELAAASGADAGYLHRVLRLTASYGLCRETLPGRFEQTPLSEALRRDAPGSVQAAILQRSDLLWWQGCGALPDTVRTGRYADGNSRKHYEYLERHPEGRERFDRGMANISQREDAAVAATWAFPAEGRIVDLGGGRGGLLAQILARTPQATGVLFEQPALLADRAALAVAPLLARCELVPGNFFEGIPAGGDVYIYKRIIHTWTAPESIRLLEMARAALAPGGRVLIVDVVIRPGNERQRGKLSDLMLMMLGAEGRERTEDEYRGLIEAAGLELVGVTDTDSAVSILEARRREP